MKVMPWKQQFLLELPSTTGREKLPAKSLEAPEELEGCTCTVTEQKRSDLAASASCLCFKHRRRWGFIPPCGWGFPCMCRFPAVFEGVHLGSALPAHGAALP